MINKTRINKPGEEQKIHKLKSKILVTEKNLNTKRGCLSPIWQCLPRPKRNPWLSQSGCNHMRSHNFSCPELLNKYIIFFKINY
jgi:hypothetical protein